MKNQMNGEAVRLMYPYLHEGYKLLREKYKYGSHEANALVHDYFCHILYEWPMDRVPKNPRREFLHGLRGWVEHYRRLSRNEAFYRR